MSYRIHYIPRIVPHQIRIITCDNLFAIVTAATRMKFSSHSLRIISTIRKNKNEIPKSFIRTGPAGMTRYAYTNDLTLLSYYPKRNKVVLILSSIYKRGRVDKEIRKPKMVCERSFNYFRPRCISAQGLLRTD